VLVLIDAYGGTSYNTTLPLMNQYQICLVPRQFADGPFGFDQSSRMALEPWPRKFLKTQENISVMSKTDISHLTL